MEDQRMEESWFNAHRDEVKNLRSDYCNYNCANNHSSKNPLFTAGFLAMMTMLYNCNLEKERKYMNDNIINYFNWCRKCIYCNNGKSVKPCSDCLNKSINHDDGKPIKFKEIKE